LPNGFAPFVRLREANGRVYPKAEEFVGDIAARLTSEQAARDEQRTSCISIRTGRTAIKTLREFHDDPRYGSDLHRADLAWAIHAVSRGLSEPQIREAILHA